MLWRVGRRVERCRYCKLSDRTVRNIFKFKKNSLRNLFFCYHTSKIKNYPFGCGNNDDSVMEKRYSLLKISLFVNVELRFLLLSSKTCVYQLQDRVCNVPKTDRSWCLSSGLFSPKKSLFSPISYRLFIFSCLTVRALGNVLKRKLRTPIDYY